MDIFLRLLTTTSAFLLISLQCTAMLLSDESPPSDGDAAPLRADHRSNSPSLNEEEAEQSLTHLPTSVRLLPSDNPSSPPGATHQSDSSSLLPFSADESLQGASSAKPPSQTFPTFFDPYAPWLPTSFSTFFTPAPPRLSIKALREHLSPPTLTELNLPAAPPLDINGIYFLIGASLPSLAKLVLKGHKIGDEGAIALSEAVWPHLQVLHLEDNDIGPEGVDALVQNRNWPQLVFFGLAGNKLGDLGIQRFVLGRCASKSRDVCSQIDVEDNGIGPDWAQDLLPTHFTRLSLTGLNLKGNRVGDQPEPEKSLLSRRFPAATLYLSSLSTSLFSASQPPQLLTFLPRTLITLNLSDCRLGSGGMRALARVSLPHLVTLYLNKNQINDEGFGILIQGQCPNLAKLYLEDNFIGTEGIRSLVENGRLLSTLSVLSLKNNSLNEDTMGPFTRGHWPVLESLNLSRNVIGPGLQYLAHTRSNRNQFPKLKHLDLGDNLIGASTVYLLGPWPALETLILTGHRITNAKDVEEQLRRHIKNIVL